MSFVDRGKRKKKNKESRGQKNQVQHFHRYQTSQEVIKGKVSKWGNKKGGVLCQQHCLQLCSKWGADRRKREQSKPWSLCLKLPRWAKGKGG